MVRRAGRPAAGHRAKLHDAAQKAIESSRGQRPAVCRRRRVFAGLDGPGPEAARDRSHAIRQDHSRSEHPTGLIDERPHDFSTRHHAPRGPQGGRCHGHARGGPGLRAGLSEPGDPHSGAVHAGWLQRHPGPGHRAGTRAGLGPAGGGGKPARRGRHRGLRARRPRGGRRLHAVHGAYGHAGRQSLALPQAQLRAAEVLCTGGAGRAGAQRTGRAPVGTRVHAGRTGGLRQGPIRTSWPTDRAAMAVRPT